MVSRQWLATVSVVAACGGLAACGGSSSSAPPASSGSTGAVQHPTSLLGDVGHNDAFTISLTDQSGQPIRDIAAGTYPLTVNDESGIHDFHLSGKGVDKLTGVSAVGKQTFSVTLSPGTYTFVCDPHSSQMHGSFKVS